MGGGEATSSTLVLCDFQICILHTMFHYLVITHVIRASLPFFLKPQIMFPEYVVGILYIFSEKQGMTARWSLPIFWH